MAVVNISMQIGQVISFALTGFMFSEITDDLTADEANRLVREGTENLIMCHNVPYIFFFCLFQLAIREKPETPPSAVAAAT